MDIAAAATSMKQAELTGKIQIAVAKKAMQMDKMQGNAAVALIQAAANVGANAIDGMNAAISGLGGSLDHNA